MFRHLPGMYVFLGILYILCSLFCFLNGMWISGALFLLNLPLWYALLQRDRQLILLLRLWLIPVGVAGLLAIYPLLPAAPGLTEPDGFWYLLLWGSLGILTLMALILTVISRLTSPKRKNQA